MPLLLMIAFHLPAGGQAWASEHFDEKEEAARDGSWRSRYAAGSVFAEDYEDNHGYSTNAETMLDDIADMFPRKFFPSGMWKKAKAKLADIDLKKMNH